MSRSLPLKGKSSKQNRLTCSFRFCQRPQGLSSKISLSSSLSSSFPSDPDFLSGTDIVILTPQITNRNPPQQNRLRSYWTVCGGSDERSGGSAETNRRLCAQCRNSHRRRHQPSSAPPWRSKHVVEAKIDGLEKIYSLRTSGCERKSHLFQINTSSAHIAGSLDELNRIEKYIRGFMRPACVQTSFAKCFVYLCGSSPWSKNAVATAEYFTGRLGEPFHARDFSFRPSSTRVIVAGSEAPTREARRTEGMEHRKDANTCAWRISWRRRKRA